MFENLLGQDELVARLRHDLSSKTLPPALLFEGPRYSGKSTAALELVRLLSCEGDSSFLCSCSSCRHHRLLSHPHLILLGSRSFVVEIESAFSSLCENGAPLRLLFLRSVRKLLRRFDATFLEGQEKFKKSVSRIIDPLEELLIPLETTLPMTDLAERGLKIVKASRQLAALISSSPTVTQLRSVIRWAHYHSPGATKCVIIESADQLLESAQNLLLKTLEEPPPGMTFILLSTRALALLPTVRSRLRPYHFVERTEEDVSQIIRRVFRKNPAPYTSLESFFSETGGSIMAECRQVGLRFTSSVLERQPFEKLPLDFLRDYPASISLVLETIQESLYNHFFHSSSPPSPESLREVVHWNDLLTTARIAAESVNQSPLLLLESLYYQLTGTTYEQVP